MAEAPGEDTLLLSSSVALSGGRIQQGGQVMLYTEDFGRGASSAAVGDDALLIREGKAQAGPASSAQITISDSQGEDSGQIILTTRDMTVEDYCGYGSEGGSAVSGPISDEMLEVGVTSFLVYENESTGERSFGFFHDKYDDSGNQFGGNVDMAISGLPDNADWAVQDDPPEKNDSYSLNPPDAYADQQWSEPNTDGLAIGKFTPSELQGVTITFDVDTYSSRNGSGPPSKIRFIGDEGTTVERPYDGTNTTITIEF